MKHSSCDASALPAQGLLQDFPEPCLTDALQLALGGLSVVQRRHAVQARRAVLADQAHQHARIRQLQPRVVAEACAQAQRVDGVRAAIVFRPLRSGQLSHS